MKDHGTTARYESGCRCKLCKKANTDRCHEARQRRGEVAAAGHPEGLPFSASTYKNHRCRCEGCTAANTVACREWRERVAG